MLKRFACIAVLMLCSSFAQAQFAGFPTIPNPIPALIQEYQVARQTLIIKYQQDRIAADIAYKQGLKRLDTEFPAKGNYLPITTGLGRGRAKRVHSPYYFAKETLRKQWVASQPKMLDLMMSLEQLQLDYQPRFKAAGIAIQQQMLAQSGLLGGGSPLEEMIHQQCPPIAQLNAVKNDIAAMEAAKARMDRINPGWYERRKQNLQMQLDMVVSSAVAYWQRSLKLSGAQDAEFKQFLIDLKTSHPTEYVAFCGKMGLKP